MTTAKSRNRLSEAVLIIVLFLLPCLFFWQLLAPNPADRATIRAGDFTEQYYPLHLFAAREWAQGHLPLWDPYIYARQPAWLSPIENPKQMCYNGSGQSAVSRT